MAYMAYLKSPEWADKRQMILRRDGFRCCRCPATERLHVHHVTYARFRREDPADLMTLCHSCHDLEHGLRPEPPDFMPELKPKRRKRRRRKR